MDLKYKKNGKVTIINLEGRLDVHLSLEIEKKINEIIDQDEIYLLFDLSQVDYLSSSGLRVFISIMRRIKALDGEIRLAHMNDAIKQTFKIVELLDLFNVYNSVTEALKDFK